MLRNSLIATLCLLMITSCVKENFDEPPVEGETDPDIETNATLAEINDLWVEGEFITIQQDLVVDAVVIADDQSGNYYRSIVVQDETAGIELLINARDLHNDFPIGRRVFINFQDLIINDYAGKIQVGGNTYTDNSGNLRLGGIEEALMGEYLIKGARNQNIQPTIKTISELSRSDLSTLVRLEGIQFISGDTSSTYADDVDLISYNLDLENCEGNSIVIRTSGFADFAGENVPNGNGSIIGVYSIFNNTKQLFIRTTEDVNFDGNRCGTSGGNCDNINGSLMNIEDVRDAFAGSTTTLPSNSYIEGTVISNANGGNINNRNMVLQGDDGFGVLVRFTNEQQFQQNDRVKVDISGQELSEYQGLLQVNNVPTSFACKSGTETVTPQVVTIAEIQNNFERYESTLVQVDNVLLSKDSGNDWIFTVTLNDGTDEIEMFTSPGANWANDRFPTDTLRITAYVSQGGNQSARQLSLRSLSDVVVIGGGGNNTEGIDEDFQSGTSFDEIDLEGWTNMSLDGERKWIYDDFSGNVFAQATSYNADDAQNDMWLVTPEINTVETSTLTFESAQAFWTHNGLSVWVSDNFTGDVNTTTWQNITTARIAGQNDDRYEWVQSGEVDLSGFGDNVHVAFRYLGNKDNETTTYRIDNVRVQ